MVGGHCSQVLVLESTTDEVFGPSEEPAETLFTVQGAFVADSKRRGTSDFEIATSNGYESDT